MNIDVYNNWCESDLYDYKRGDIIELLTDRFLDYGWDVGHILTISTVYTDGDVYAIDSFSGGRVLKPNDFKIHKMSFGNIDISIKIMSNIIPGLVRSHMERYEKDKALAREKSSSTYYKNTGNSYSPVYSSNSRYCNVSYYSIDNGVLGVYPRIFYTVDTFLAFCEENNIIITDADKNKLRSFSYAHCYYDEVTQSLVYATSYSRLKELYSLFADSGNNSDVNDDYYMIFNAKDSDYKLVSVKYNENQSALTSFMFECERGKVPYLFKTRDEAYRCKTLISNRINNCIDMVVIRYKDYVEHTS